MSWHWVRTELPLPRQEEQRAEELASRLRALREEQQGAQPAPQGAGADPAESGLPTEATPGVYGLWQPAPAGGAAQRLVIWVVLDSRWAQLGPAPQDPELPLVQALLGKLMSTQWWDAQRAEELTVPVVLEWPWALAARSSHPPPIPPAVLPAVSSSLPLPTPTSLARTPLTRRPALGRSFHAPTSLDEDEDDPLVDDLNDLENSPQQHAILAERRAEPAPAPQGASLLYVCRGRLQRSGQTIGGEVSPVLPQRIPAPEGREHPLHTWLAWAEAAPPPEPAPPPSADPNTAEQDPEDVLSPRCGLWGGRVGHLLPCWLSRQLVLAQPAARSGAKEPGAERLVTQLVREPWKEMLREALSSTAGVVLLAALAAVGANLASRVRVEPSPPPPTPAPGPAIAPCSADHAAFVNELRCQVTWMSAPGARLDGSPHCGDEGSQEVWTGSVEDLRPGLCGLLDREQEEWLGNLDDDLPRSAHGQPLGLRYNFAELAVSQACFNSLARPEVYKQPRSDGRLLADPTHLLHDPSRQISALVLLMSDLRQACEEYDSRMEASLQGAIFSTYIGAGPPPSPDENEPSARQAQPGEGEAYNLRQTLVELAVLGLPDTLRPCFTRAVARGLSWSPGEPLCGWDAPPMRAEGGRVWEVLGPPNDDQPGQAKDSPTGRAPSQRELLTRYTDARFSQATQQSVRSQEWDCHLELIADGRGGVMEGLWGLTLPRPGGYGSGRGVQQQLRLDAGLLAMDEGTQDPGPCWGVVRKLLSGYTPRHPLRAELDPERWVSTEQQLCGQVCAAYYLARPTEREGWWTPNGDLDLCVDKRESLDEKNQSPSLGSQKGQVGLDVLQLPWNESWYRAVRTRTGWKPVVRTVPGSTAPIVGWQEPSRAQVCAFHLIAQDLLPAGEDGLLLGQRTGDTWAGMATWANGLAGGEGGDVLTALFAMSIGRDSDPEQAGGAYSTQGCADVATQCYVRELLETVHSQIQRPHLWKDLWNAQIDAMYNADPGDLALKDPWCATLQTRMRSAPLSSIETSCTIGVAFARDHVEASLEGLVALHRGGVKQ